MLRYEYIRYITSLPVHASPTQIRHCHRHLHPSLLHSMQLCRSYDAASSSPIGSLPLVPSLVGAVSALGSFCSLALLCITSSSCPSFPRPVLALPVDVSLCTPYEVHRTLVGALNSNSLSLAQARPWLRCLPYLSIAYFPAWSVSNYYDHKAGLFVPGHRFLCWTAGLTNLFHIPVTTNALGAAPLELIPPCRC